MGFTVFGPMMDIKNLILLSGGFSRKFVLRLCLTLLLYLRNGRFPVIFHRAGKEPAMTKNCWNSQALAEISCYLAFAGGYAVSGAFRAVPLLCDAKAGAPSLLPVRR